MTVWSNILKKNPATGEPTAKSPVNSFASTLMAATKINNNQPRWQLFIARL